MRRLSLLMSLNVLAGKEALEVMLPSASTEDPSEVELENADEIGESQAMKASEPASAKKQKAPSSPRGQKRSAASALARSSPNVKSQRA